MADDTREQGPESFATVDDLAKRWHTLTESESEQADLLLGDASDKIRARVPEAEDPAWVIAHKATLRRICCSMVKRAMQQTLAGIPEGVSQSNMTTGPFSNGYTWSNPDGNLWLTKEELKDLGAGKQRAFSIEMGG